jgi:hypothetical protein
MLASLLPGLRDLRTPLTTGYLWLIFLWLWFHDDFPTTEVAASGPLRSLFEVGTLVGATAALAAVSVFAYVVGSVIVVRIPWNIFWGSSNLDAASTPIFERSITFYSAILAVISRPFRAQLKRLAEQLAAIVAHKFDESAGGALPGDYRAALGVAHPSTDPPTSVRDQDAFAEAIKGDLPAVGIQLQARNRDLWDTFDRARAESEFRSGLVLPLAAITIVVVTQSNLLWLLLLVVPVVLLEVAVGKSIEATDTLVQAIALKIVEPSIFVRLDEIIARNEVSSRAMQRAVAKNKPANGQQT